MRERRAPHLENVQDETPGKEAQHSRCRIYFRIKLPTPENTINIMGVPNARQH